MFLIERIISAAMKVHNILGPGFLEKVYENALVIELRSMDLSVEQQKPIPVFYEGHNVGDYFADIIVEKKVLVELKAAIGLTDAHAGVCLNYLRCAALPVCLLLNFGTPRLQIKRLVSSHYDPNDPL